MLIDEFLPGYDISKKHSVNVNAEPEKIIGVLKSTKFDSVVIKLLLKLRGIKTEEISINTSRGYFIFLGENSNEEILYGITGKFWKWKGSLIRIKKEEFTDFSLTGYAKAVWNFSVSKSGNGKTVLSTETRIKCYGDSARKKFRFYWGIIQPFSGIIRRIILNRIKYLAEK